MLDNFQWVGGGGGDLKNVANDVSALIQNALTNPSVYF